MKNVIPLVCLATMALVVAGVKMTHPTAKLESIVWYGNAVHPYITEVRKGVEAFAKDSGVPVYCTVGQEWTQDNQNVNVEALSTAGYKGFSLFPGDAVGANGLFKMLRDHGQNVVAYGAQPAMPTPVAFTVGTNIKGAAMTATEELIRLMGGHGKILNLLEASTDVNTRARDEGIREVVAHHPDVQIIQTLSDMIKMGDATTKLQSALAARAGDIDGIIATGFNPTVAAASILTEWNRDPTHKRIHFVGIDTDSTVLAAIQDGSIDATVAQNPFGHGYLSCLIVNLLNDGWTPRQPYQFIDAGIVIVHRDNLDTYAAKVRQMTTDLAGEIKTRYLNPPK